MACNAQVQDGAGSMVSTAAHRTAPKAAPNTQWTALEPLRPVFIGLTLLFLGLSFRKVYLNPQSCVPGAACADPHTVKRQRGMFWAVTVLALTLLAVPWVAP